MLVDGVKWVGRRLLGSEYKSNFWGFWFDVLHRSYRVSGMAFEIPRELTNRAFRSRFFWNVYEWEERQLIERYVRDTDVIIELGGCLGVVACVTNLRLRDKRNHVVVEANPALIPCLKLNRDRNGAAFTIEQCMISRSSDGTFFVHGLVVGGSADRETPDAIKVPVKTIDHVQSEHGLQFNVAILDIEGGELSFVAENPAFLTQLDLVIIELHEFIIGRDACDRCREHLRQAGLERGDRVGGCEAWFRPPRREAGPHAGVAS